jgi:starvation-inducible DNA-binding protein
MTTTIHFAGGPAHLDEGARAAVSSALRDILVDAIDLHSHLKVAHWNIRGPHFASLHPLFDTYATALQTWIDLVAERCVVLGRLAVGTTRHVAANSRLHDYPQDVVQDLEHVALLGERIDEFLKFANEARQVADQNQDQDSAEVMTQVISEFDKHAWFLRATLGD